jgi:serine/threonine protein kinase
MKTDRLLNGRFRLLENIARGGQGTVWLAEDTVLGREVALKQLIEPAGPARLPGYREYAMREAHALACVNHHTVVTIHDVFLVDEDPWLVMWYVLGKPLSKILTAGPLNERQVAAVALRVLQGLSAAHRQRRGALRRQAGRHPRGRRRDRAGGLRDGPPGWVPVADRPAVPTVNAGVHGAGAL